MLQLCVLLNLDFRTLGTGHLLLWVVHGNIWHALQVRWSHVID